LLRAPEVFSGNGDTLTEWFKWASEASGIKITPKILRDWFACKMGELGVADRYVDAFCGRVPRSVLARHYTDFSPRTVEADIRRCRPESSRIEFDRLVMPYGVDYFLF